MYTDIETGPEALLNPKENRSAQLQSIFAYGLPSGGIIGAIAFVLGIAVSGGDALFGVILFILGFLVGFFTSFWNVQAPLNAVPTFLGGYDERWLGPSGIQCYWSRLLFGKLNIRVAIGERNMEEFPIQDVETKNGTRFTVWVEIRRWYVRWPLLYVRSIGSSGNPEAALKKVIEATVRKYIGLYEDDEVMEVRDMHKRLSDVLSGEQDEVLIPADPAEGESFVRFSFSGGDSEKTIRRQLMLLGVFIPNGGVNVTNINEPDDVAAAKSEERQQESRERAIATRVKQRRKLQDENPGVDIDKVEENVLADAGKIDIVVTRGNAGDFAKGAAISTSKKRR